MNNAIEIKGIDVSLNGFKLKNINLDIPKGVVVGLIGMAFGAGWTPCNGPIIGAIFAMSASAPNNALMLMIVYCLGFAIPFFILSFFVSRTRWMLKYSNIIMKIGGITMILMGILLYFDGLTQIIIWLQPYFGDFQGF